VKVVLVAIAHLGSCSNCTSYQATRLNIKYRLKKGGTEKDFVHTLNSTIVANPRTIVAILEVYQQDDGSVKPLRNEGNSTQILVQSVTFHLLNSS